MKEGIQKTGPPPGRTFCSSDSSSSSADISSPGSLKKEVFSTLEAQKFLVYDRLDVEQNFRWELMAKLMDVIYPHGVRGSHRMVVDVMSYKQRRGVLLFVNLFYLIQYS